MHTATDLLEKMLARMSIHARVEGSERHGEVYLNIQSEDSGLLIGRRGQTIDALQYLVNRMVNRDADAAVRIVLDTEHYQERREERLTRLAQRLAAQVKSTGRAAVMAPLNARDRRIIHLALQGDREVSTSSKGEGALRKVLIAPRRIERSQSREV
jgi:spoIIIJ-associated protein